MYTTILNKLYYILWPVVNKKMTVITKDLIHYFGNLVPRLPSSFDHGYSVLCDVLESHGPPLELTAPTTEKQDTDHPGDTDHQDTYHYQSRHTYLLSS